MFTVKPVPGRGFGLVATTNIPAHQTIIQLTGNLTYDLPRTHHLERFLLQVGVDKNGRGIYLAPQQEEPWKYVNHSCHPNLRLEVSGLLREPDSLSLVSIHAISAKEELTLDYSTTQTEPWQMICFCSSKHCRDVIGPVQTLPLLSKIKYLGTAALPRFTWSSLFHKKK